MLKKLLAYNKIGFNDTLLFVVLIPTLAFIIPIVFFNMRFQHAPFFTKEMFLTSLAISATILLGNRFILIWARTRYPRFAEIRKRLRVQSIIMLVFTLVADNVLGSSLKGFCERNNVGNMGNMTAIDSFISSNSASIFCTLMVVAIYESRFFIGELKNSIQQTEMLKRESLHAQLNALKTQVNPHFLFNNLNTLCAIIPDNPTQSVNFVQQLAKVYRHILEVKDEKSIPLKEEMEVLKAYTFLLKTRFADNLCIDIEIPKADMELKVVPLSLQLLLENAIKHNIISADKPLTIKISSVDGSLVVTNNLQKKNQITESTGIGLKNIYNRYRLLTDRLVGITETTLNFTVSIPLIPN